VVPYPCKAQLPPDFSASILSSSQRKHIAPRLSTSYHEENKLSMKLEPHSFTPGTRSHVIALCNCVNTPYPPPQSISVSFLAGKGVALAQAYTSCA